MSTRPPLRVVVAPDSFKGSLGAPEAAAALAAGVRQVAPDASIAVRPMADGGEGTLDALLAAWGSPPRTVATTDALGRPRTARYGISPDGGTGVVELAEASGLPHVADLPPAPRDATTEGTGVVARAVLDAGVRDVLLCLGGSATTDGGTGVLTALGVRLLDAAGEPVRPGGAGLAAIATVDDSGLHPRAREVGWRLAVDVTSPLTGPDGAAAVYGPQKGATPDDVLVLDAGLENLARVLRAHAGTDVRTLPGTGAAGGVPAGLVALLGARLLPGAVVVGQAGGLDAALAGADLVLTGEGRLDRQSVSGKVVGTLAALADEAAADGRRPAVVVIAGQVALSPAQCSSNGVDAAFSLADGPADLDRLVGDAADLLQDVAAHVTRLFLAGRA